MTNSVADFLTIDEEVVLVLTLTVGDVWKPKFTFTLLPVGLDRVDILEGLLRDAQEEIGQLKSCVDDAQVEIGQLKSCVDAAQKEIAALKQSSKVVYLSLCGAGSSITGALKWGGVNGYIDTTHFELNSERDEVTVLKSGVFMVQIRWDSYSGELHKNGAAIALCRGSHHGNSSHIAEILCLNANDVLQVTLRNCPNQYQANVLINRLTILKL